ncbi:hypothetical protein EYV94_24840 [Puteibacter caeruleilacunae]|nr:hypothetical protein EYV94_24840 [Puteibacter caeruleilacunae]
MDCIKGKVKTSIVWGAFHDKRYPFQVGGIHILQKSIQILFSNLMYAITHCFTLLLYQPLIPGILQFVGFVVTLDLIIYGTILLCYFAMFFVIYEREIGVVG